MSPHQPAGSDAPGDPPTDPFLRRHIGPSAAERDRMLAALGYDCVDALMRAAIPAAIIEPGTAPDLPAPVSEPEMLAELRAIAACNSGNTPMLGLGYYNTYTPAVLARGIIANPAWYTAYTPYQPEISQGRLEALLNFQTMITELTGADVAGASVLDEPTAAAEAMTLARRATRASETAVFVVDADVLPQTIAVLRTRAEPLGIPIIVTDVNNGLPDGVIFGVLLQYPGASGGVADHTETIAAARHRGALAIVAADLLALALLRSPGELGADVVVGSAQRFGVPLGFGGPHAGYIAVLTALARLLPGRLVGVSRDADDNPAYRLALQTREQHIRREKATSNICTAQVLLAVVAGAYGVWHGPDGLRAIAQRTHRHAVTLARGLQAGGVEVTQRSFFDTVTARVPGRAVSVVAAAATGGVMLRQIDDDHVGIACDETTTRKQLELVWQAFGVAAVPDGTAEADTITVFSTEAIPSQLRRADAPLRHPVFRRYHSETAMMRYLRRLADTDYALDRGMIPLGSCTMKLNAAAELAPISWPEFADIHPFAPADQTTGYGQLIEDLQRWLAELTGYDAVSVQPNAGSQGELAGLLAIRAYHRATRDATGPAGAPERDICLIPASAHGTNAASAVMAGMRVVVVACDAAGNVDHADVHAKLAEHADHLAALMVTYPSTHGVYERGIETICAAVHDAGGQVYVDGANLNALVGYARPGRFGADVSHLNLHKTFCIPHGGGGPGVGPVAVRAHLAPYLPNHPLRPDAGPTTGPGPVAGAPWG
ncbi:MAG: aminomethyl-transferring glycine dehydrogenase, partial [Mycobacteriales bacterium]